MFEWLPYEEGIKTMSLVGLEIVLRFEWLPYEEGTKTQVAHDALNG